MTMVVTNVGSGIDEHRFRKSAFCQSSVREFGRGTLVRLSLVLTMFGSSAASPAMARADQDGQAVESSHARPFGVRVAASATIVPPDFAEPRKEKASAASDVPRASSALGPKKEGKGPRAGDPSAHARKLPAENTKLLLPDESSSLETVERSLQGVGLVGSQLVMFTQGKSQAITTSFDPLAESRAARFGALTAQLRRSLPQEFGPSWRGVLDGGGVFMLLDGRNLALTEVDPQSWTVVLRRSLPWDQLRPAEDRGGEATVGETAAMRSDFRQSFVATPGLKIAGMAAIPSAWVGGKGRHFLAATRIARYPLLLVSCFEESSACEVTRACRLHKAADLLPASIAGIGVSAARRLVVLGDEKRHRLLGFRFESCYSVVRQGSWILPVAKLPGAGGAKDDDNRLQLGNLTIDGEDRLWVATEFPDHFLSASLYMWRADQW